MAERQPIRSLDAPGVQPRYPARPAPVAEAFADLLQGLTGVAQGAAQVAQEHKKVRDVETQRAAWKKIDAGEKVTSSDFYSRDAEESFFYDYAHQKARMFNVDAFEKFKAENPHLANDLDALSAYADVEMENATPQARQIYLSYVTQDVASKRKEQNQLSEGKLFDLATSGLTAAGVRADPAFPDELKRQAELFDKNPNSRYSAQDVYHAVLPQVVGTLIDENKDAELGVLNEWAKANGLSNYTAGAKEKAEAGRREKGLFDTRNRVAQIASFDERRKAWWEAERNGEISAAQREDGIDRENQDERAEIDHRQTNHRLEVDQLIGQAAGTGAMDAQDAAAFLDQFRVLPPTDYNFISESEAGAILSRHFRKDNKAWRREAMNQARAEVLRYGRASDVAYEDMDGNVQRLDGDTLTKWVLADMEAEIPAIAAATGQDPIALYAKASKDTGQPMQSLKDALDGASKLLSSGDLVNMAKEGNWVVPEKLAVAYQTFKTLKSAEFGDSILAAHAKSEDIRFLELYDEGLRYGKNGKEALAGAVWSMVNAPNQRISEQALDDALEDQWGGFAEYRNSADVMTIARRVATFYLKTGMRSESEAVKRAIQHLKDRSFVLADTFITTPNRRSKLLLDEKAAILGWYNEATKRAVEAGGDSDDMALLSDEAGQTWMLYDYRTGVPLADSATGWREIGENFQKLDEERKQELIRQVQAQYDESKNVFEWLERERESTFQRGNVLAESIGGL